MGSAQILVGAGNLVCKANCGTFAGGWWEGVLGRAEGPGPCVVRSRLLLRPAQWNVRPSRARLPLRLKFFRIAK